MPQIIVTISPQGESTVTTHGYAGSSCQQASAEFEAALGLKTHEQLTPEFYQSQAAQAEQQQRH